MFMILCCLCAISCSTCICILSSGFAIFSHVRFNEWNILNYVLLYPYPLVHDLLSYFIEPYHQLPVFDSISRNTIWYSDLATSHDIPVNPWGIFRILSPFPPDDLRVYTTPAVIVSFREDWIKIVSSLLPVSFMIWSESIGMILTKSRLTENPVKGTPSASISPYS